MLIDEIYLKQPAMCYLQMLSPIKTLEYRQIQTSIWVMFQNCTFKSIICNSEHIFPQKQWQAGLERPILPMMYLKCGSIQKSTVEPQIKKKKNSVGVFRIPTRGG